MIGCTTSGAKLVLNKIFDTASDDIRLLNVNFRFF